MSDLMNLTSKKVFFVDDDEAVLSIVKIILEEERIEVITSTTLLSLDELSVIKPDVLLLDEWIGTKKGSEYCREIKNVEAHSNMRIVLISAVNNLGKIAEECAADAFIEKPFDLDELVGVVKSLLL